MRHKLLGFKCKIFASEKCFVEEKQFESSNLGFSCAPKKYLFATNIYYWFSSKLSPIFQCEQLEVPLIHRLTKWQIDKQSILSFVWLCMAKCDYIRPCTTLYGYVWLFMIIYDYVWFHMTIIMFY